MPTLPQTGRCQCGAIEYTITAAPLLSYNCHCTNCQRISGSPFATTMVVPEAGFEITQGNPKRHEWPSDVGSNRYGFFCGDCGTRIAHGVDPSVGVLSLRAGTLDDTSWVHPVGDTWTTSAQPWIKFTGERLEYPHQPEEYSALAMAFAALNLFSD